MSEIERFINAGFEAQVDGCDIRVNGVKLFAWEHGGTSFGSVGLMSN